MALGPVGRAALPRLRPASVLSGAMTTATAEVSAFTVSLCSSPRRAGSVSGVHAWFDKT